MEGYFQREQPHLLRAYDADFLTDAVIGAKQRCQRSLTASAGERLARGQLDRKAVGRGGLLSFVIG